VFAALNRSAGPELLSLDLTMGQFKSMAMLTMNGPQPVGELGRRLGISEPAASLLVDKLEELGLAVRERDPKDRRRTLVTPTPAAEELAARLRQGREEHILAWLGALTDEELDGLTRGFRGLMSIAAEDSAPDVTASAPPVAEVPRG
jgi:DNA-binding MarR family transcriptional regulator